MHLQVWGKTMVCKDRTIAEKVAAGGRLDAITMDGDLIRSKGTISGGYQDAQKSKIRSYHKVRGCGGGRNRSGRECTRNPSTRFGKGGREEQRGLNTRWVELCVKEPEAIKRHVWEHTQTH
jgi:hypothetical protein